MGCPVKNESWKRLVKYSGDETTAYRVFRAHGGKIPPVPSITDLKKDIKFKMRIFTGLEKALLNLRVGGYNKKNNTSHSIDYSKLSGSTEKATLVMNFFPKNVSSVIPKTKVIAKSGDVRTEITVDPSEVYVMSGNQYIVGGEVFSSFEDANNSLNNIQKNEDGLDLKQIWEIHAYNAHDALKYLAKDSKWEYGSKIAKELLKNDLPTTKIEVLSNEDFHSQINTYKKEIGTPHVEDVSHISGTYLPKYNTILLRETSSEKTMLHEVIHAITANALSKTNNAEVKEFHEIYEVISDYLGHSLEYEDMFYGATNANEFIAELFSNEEFVEVLKNIPYIKDDNISTFQKIIEAIRDLLGLSETMYDKAFESAMNIAKKSSVMSTVSFLDYNNLNSEELSVGLQKLKDALDKAIKRLGHKESIAKKSSSKVENSVARAISELTRKVQTELEQGEYLKATTELFEELLSQEVNFMTKDISAYVNNEEPTEAITSSYINRMDTSVKLYGKVMSDVRVVLNQQRDYKELIPIAENLSELLLKFNKELEHISDFVKEQSKSRTIKIIEDEVGRENLDRPVEQMVEDIETDISQAGVYFGTLANSPDQIMRAIYKIVVFQQMETTRIAQAIGKDFVLIQEALEKSGVKDLSIFHENYNGNKTGYLISGKNWGEYFETKKVAYAAYEKSLKPLGIGSINDMPSYDTLSKDKELSDKIKALKEKHIHPWRKKYERLIEGSWHKNPPINYKYRKLMENPLIKEYYDAFRDNLEKSKDMLPNSYNGTEYARLLMPQIRRNTMEIMKSQDNVLRGLWNRLKDSVLKTDQDTDFGYDTIVEDAAGNPAKLIPIHYSVRMKDPNDLSDDMTSMAVTYFLYKEL